MHLGEILEGVGLDGNGEGLARMSWCRVATATANPGGRLDAARCPLDVGRVDVRGGR